MAMSTENPECCEYSLKSTAYLVHANYLLYVFGKRGHSLECFKSMLPIKPKFFSSFDEAKRENGTAEYTFDHCSVTGHMPALQRACDDPADYNPKLGMLEEILLQMMEKSQVSEPSLLLSLFWLLWRSCSPPPFFPLHCR